MQGYFEGGKELKELNSYINSAIAAGLAMKLIITFETSVLEEFHDSIKIVSDGGFSIDIPLHAYPP